MTELRQMPLSPNDIKVISKTVLHMSQNLRRNVESVSLSLLIFIKDSNWTSETYDYNFCSKEAQDGNNGRQRSMRGNIINGN